MPVFLRSLLRLGPLNPIAVRLVSNGSRRSRHHYIRIAYLGSLIVVLLYALLVEVRGDAVSYRDLAAAGATSFAWIAYLQIALICILAPVFMAGAIAQEADPRTWDILLTTPLGAGEIVLGNLFGRLFFILALLFSSLPLFAVTQYFGGVRGTTIFSSFLIAACAALLVGTMAIALSVSRLVGRRAVFTFYVSVVSYLAITIAIDALSRVGPTVTWMTAINPFLALQALLNPTGYALRPEGSQSGLAVWFLERPVATFCLLSSAISLLLMVVSVITVRIGGFAGFGSAGAGPQASFFRRILGRAAAEGSGIRAPRAVWHNPIAWREAAGRTQTLGRAAGRWLFIASGVALGLAFIVLVHRGAFTPAQFRTAVFVTVIGEIGVICLVAINMAATSISREREDGTLDILLTTPIQASAYLAGKLRGMVTWLLPMLVVPIVTVAAAGLYSAFGGFGRADNAAVAFVPTAQLGFGGPAAGGAAATINVPFVLPEALVVMTLVAVPFTAFCVIVGMLWSLRSRGTIASVASTVGVVAAVAGTIGLCAWNASQQIQIIGPVLGAASPASAAFALIFPEEGMFTTINRSGELMGARTCLLVGALISAVLHGVVVWSLHASMTRNFDMTVRKLAGLK